MTHHLNEDVCLDLLHGLLSVEERDRVLEHVGSCAGCEQLFGRYAAHEERVRARGDLRFQPDGSLALEPWLRKVSEAPEPDSPPSQNVIPLRRYFQVAAGLAAVAAAVILIFVIPASQQQPIAELLRPVPGVGEQIHLRSEPGSAVDEDFLDGIEAYASGDLQATVDLLQKAEVTGQRDNLRRIYLGSALARLGQYEDAVEILESVSFASVPDPWGGEGRWTLYVVYAANGQASEAEAILNELSRESGQFGDRARATLEAK